MCHFDHLSGLQEQICGGVETKRYHSCPRQLPYQELNSHESAQGHCDTILHFFLLSLRSQFRQKVFYQFENIERIGFVLLSQGLDYSKDSKIKLCCSIDSIISLFISRIDVPALDP